jgi:hypothetical protein
VRCREPGAHEVRHPRSGRQASPPATPESPLPVAARAQRRRAADLEPPTGVTCGVQCKVSEERRNGRGGGALAHGRCHLDLLGGSRSDRAACHRHAINGGSHALEIDEERVAIFDQPLELLLKLHCELLVGKVAAEVEHVGLPRQSVQELAPFLFAISFLPSTR